VFDIQKDEKLQYLEPNIKIPNFVFNASEAFEKFIIHTHLVRLCKSVYGAAAVRPFVVNNQIRSFQLHDESVVNFDLCGCSSFSLFSVYDVLCHTSFRLWWIPWDIGRKTLNLSVTHTFEAVFTIYVCITLTSTYQEPISIMIPIQINHSLFFQISFNLRDSGKKTSVCRIAFSLVMNVIGMVCRITICKITLFLFFLAKSAFYISVFAAYEE
jgi:hypothetical protein